MNISALARAAALRIDANDLRNAEAFLHRKLHALLEIGKDDIAQLVRCAIEDLDGAAAKLERDAITLERHGE